MKKQLVLLAACAVVMASGSAFASDVMKISETAPTKKVECKKEKPCDKECWEAKKAKFDQKLAEEEARLKLTAKQKAQAKALREKTRKELDPIMADLKVKHERLIEIKNDKLAWAKRAEKKEKAQLKADIETLHQKAKDIRDKSMASYENILTKAQKVEFEKIKAEHKAKMEEFKAKKEEMKKEHKFHMFKKDCKCKKPCKDKKPEAKAPGTGK